MLANASVALILIPRPQKLARFFADASPWRLMALKWMAPKGGAVTLLHVDLHEHTSTYVDMRRFTSTHVDVRTRTSSHVDLRRRTSMYVDVHPRMSTYVRVGRRTST